MRSIGVMSFGISRPKNNDQNDVTDNVKHEIDNKNVAWEHVKELLTKETQLCAAHFQVEKIDSLNTSSQLVVPDSSGQSWMFLISDWFDSELHQLLDNEKKLHLWLWHSDSILKLHPAEAQ